MREFINFSLNAKENLYNLKHNEGYRVFCECEEDMPEMTIGKRNDTYYFRNYIKNGEKHKSTCNLHSSFSGGGESEKGWTEKDGKLNINLNKAAFGIKNAKVKNPTTHVPQVTVSDRKRNDISTVTLLGLASKLNIMAWDRYIKNNNGIPEHISELTSQAFGMSNLININKGKTLNDYWYSYPKLLKLPKNALLFIYMPLNYIQERKGSKMCNIVLSPFFKKEEKTAYISCSMGLIGNALNSIRTKDIKKDGEIFHSIVAGFIKKNNLGRGEFVSISFIPILEEGLWYESSYEKHVYNELIKQKRIFTKGYKAIESYGGFIPDIIFLDREKDMYGEVFGIQNIESYDERKEEKIKLAKESKELFDFWYWDVNKSLTPPGFDK